MSAGEDGKRGQKAVSRCPICRKPTVKDHRPFCSERCTDVDLGRWLNGAYAVPGEPVDESQTEPSAGWDND